LIDLSQLELRGGAVLIVRLVRVTVPSLDGLASPATARLVEEALRERLAALIRDAQRPMRGPVAAEADSVLFVDRSELLACLIRDLVAGQAPERWWWRRMKLDLESPGAALAHATLAEPRALPAALRALEWVERRAAVASQSPVQARLILTALRRVYDVPLHSEVAPRPAPVAHAPTVDRATIVPAVGPPWRRWLSLAAAAGLSSDQEEVLGTTLVLALAPHAVRRADFAAHVAAWRSSYVADRIAEPTSFDTPPLTEAGTLPEVARTAPLAAPLPAPSPLTAPAGTAPPPPLIFDPAAPAGSHPPAPPGGAPQPARPAWEVLQGPRYPFTEDGVITEWGGLLYLINLLDRLGPATDWAPSDRLASLGGWAGLELFARGLLALAGIDAAADPLFDLFAALDGREPAAPLGADVHPPRPFRRPAAWHAWATTVPRIARLRRPVAVAPGAWWWLQRAVGSVEALLRALLGPELPDGVPVAAALQATGRVVVTRTHVDLVLPLDAVRLPIRCAGLDQDPGWRPDLGRIVLFHFE
jgi:hypothetical protein